jgi:hypothetical protein
MSGPNCFVEKIAGWLLAGHGTALSGKRLPVGGRGLVQVPAFDFSPI